VQVAYRTDVPGLVKLMIDLARKHPRVLPDPEPTAQVLNLAESGIDVELGFWIQDPEQGSQNVRSDLSVAILSEFQARGIEIPYPQREVRLLGAGPDPNSHRN
jgi:small-conductance mechanosensitive channel